MEKLRSVLITDRTRRDVNRAEELLKRFDSSGVWRGSQSELAELTASKGIYTPVDLNRVMRACAWLAGRLEGYGYSVPSEYYPAVLIRVTPEPKKAGEISGILAYKGETAVLKASGKRGYEFNHWEEDGKTISTDQEYSFAAEHDRELVAVFDAPLEESGMVGFCIVGRAVVGREV